jgi:UDP:flavonoid glycosyltransferase YjiC (YdhE family)
VAAELGHLLEDPAYSQRAAEMAVKVRHEDGVKAACDAVESVF